jgi:hypothetical protein
LKPERWGSSLVQEKYQEENAGDKRHPYRIIIIIIIIIITAACEQLASTEYAKRHDGVAKVIHQKLAEAAELIEDKSP